MTVKDLRRVLDALEDETPVFFSIPHGGVVLPAQAAGLCSVYIRNPDRGNDVWDLTIEPKPNSQVALVLHNYRRHR